MKMISILKLKEIPESPAYGEEDLLVMAATVHLQYCVLEMLRL